MGPDRWSKVKEIVQRALELSPEARSDFVERACDSDPSLRREVESLLSEPPTGFLDSPVRRVSAHTPEPTGKTVSHYRIGEEISRGGMGVVYRALDLKLDREVALKVLPPELIENPERRRRFVREAKAAASLSHPNIATIHDIEEADGITFIAMELIQGEKLGELLKRGPLPLSQALDLMIEVVEGVALAHREGIVHRDLKPANLMVTDTGHAKIIDFGLAKLVEPFGVDDPARTHPRTDTAPGFLMGTLSYMSPEQARGEAVDHRTDIFTLGIVLYETIAGELPFKAPSTAEIPHAIINNSAPRLQLPDAVAPELQRILDRCLAKDPDGRYPKADLLLGELRAVRDAERRSAPRAPRARAGWLPAAVLGAAAAAVAVFFFLGREPVTAGVPGFANPIQVTSALGAEDFPSWSPDGLTLAFESNRSGNWDIWIVGLSGEPFNRTPDHAGEDRFPSWSPDGSKLAFWSDREGEGYYVMSALAGPARKVVSGDPAGPLHWSKDGTELTHVLVDEEGVFLETVSLEGKSKRRVEAPGANVNRMFPVWSPDERLVAYNDASAFNSAVHPLLLLRLSDGEVFPITDGSTRVWNASWSVDGRRLFYISSRGSLGDLWQQYLSSDGEPIGPPSQVTTGLGLRNAVLSPDGTRLAYSRGRRMVNLWRIPILPDRPATWSDAKPLTFDQAFLAYVGLAGRGNLAVSSDRHGGMDLWILPKDGGAMRQVTADPAPDFGPVGSPDGKEVLFYSSRSGSRDVWLVPVEGGAARQITFDPTEEWHPDWSPDGGEIAYMSTRAGSTDVWVVSRDGGEPRQITTDPASDQFPRWRPQGREILFASRNAMWLVSADGGEPRQVSEHDRWGYPRWHPDGSRAYFTQLRKSTGHIWELSLETGKSRPVTDLTGRPGTLHALALATDGDFLYFGWDEDMGDIWVVDLVE